MAARRVACRETVGPWRKRVLDDAVMTLPSPAPPRFLSPLSQMDLPSREGTACASWRPPEPKPRAARTTPAVPQVDLHRPSGAPSCPARGAGRPPSIWHLLAAAVTAPVCLETACPAPWPHTSVFGAQSILCLMPQSFLNPATCPTPHPGWLDMDLPPTLPWSSSLLLPQHLQYLLSTPLFLAALPVPAAVPSVFSL